MGDGIDRSLDTSNPLYTPTGGDRLDQLAAKARAKTVGNQPTGPGGRMSRLAQWVAASVDERPGMEEYWRKKDGAKFKQQLDQKKAEDERRARIKQSIADIRTMGGNGNGNPK
jgi:phage-related minor tail protein